MKKSGRNSNIELLRIILIIMVITLHFNNGDMGGGFNMVQDNMLGRVILYLLESLSICAVNCFMIISGYFLAYNKKVKLGKIVDLLLIVIFYRVVEYFVSIVFTQADFSVVKFAGKLLPVNYFAIFYIVTYIFSPYISKLFDSVNKISQKLLIEISLLIFVIWPTITDVIMNIVPSLPLDGVSTISTSGNLAGYSVVQFFVDVLIGMYLRRSNLNPKIGLLITGYLISVVIMTFGIFKITSLYNYCSIFTVISATCLFLLFNKLSIQSKLINFISKSVFAIFCIHTLPLTNSLWVKYFITPEHISMSTGKMVIWTFISIIIMFLFCLIIDIFVRYTFGLLKNKICSKCPVIINIEE